MTKRADSELKTLEAKATATQAAYDAARSAYEDGETYAKSLEADYREALENPRDFDRLTDLQAKRSAVGAVLADLQTVRDTADKENGDAGDELRKETRLQGALEGFSPKVQAVVRAWKAGTLPSIVRLKSGDFALYSLIEKYINEIHRGNPDYIRRQFEDTAERVELSGRD